MVLGWFDDQANFKYVHDQKIEIDQIENWLKINCSLMVFTSEMCELCN
jgi:hypothetical protein